MLIIKINDVRLYCNILLVDDLVFLGIMEVNVKRVVKYIVYRILFVVSLVVEIEEDILRVFETVI